MYDNPINQLAFEWLARADAGLGSREQAELDAWLAEDPRHLGAYFRAKAVFSQAQRATVFANSPVSERWFRDPPAGVRSAATELPTADNDQDVSMRISRRSLMGLAGSIAIGGWAIFASGQRAQAMTFRTGTGEMRDIALEDGTKVSLNTQSEIRVRIGKEQRLVELISGEALFDVAQDAERPFILDTIGFQARALGTSFAVRQLQGAAPQIVVMEGIVDITPVNATSLRVAANTRITFYARGKVARKMLTRADLGQELIWREGKIAFDDTTLRDAIAAFGRYGAVHIEVEDPRILDRTVTGIFSWDDPMGFAVAVSNLLDVEAVPEGRGVVLRGK